LKSYIENFSLKQWRSYFVAKLITGFSPVNEFVTEIGSGQVSLIGDETSFFISAETKTLFFFTFLGKPTHGSLRCGQKGSKVLIPFQSAINREKYLMPSSTQNGWLRLTMLQRRKQI